MSYKHINCTSVYSVLYSLSLQFKKLHYHLLSSYLREEQYLCTALFLTVFGPKHSLMDIMELQVVSVKLLAHFPHQTYQDKIKSCKLRISSSTSWVRLKISIFIINRVIFKFSPKIIFFLINFYYFYFKSRYLLFVGFFLSK